MVKQMRTERRHINPRRTVTVKFEAAKLSPDQMEKLLDEAVATLVKAGAISSPTVIEVFGEDFDAELRNLYTIDFDGPADRLLSELKNVQDVEYAHIAPIRTALGA